MIKWRCDGLTEQQWDAYKADPVAVGVIIKAELSCTELPDDEGHKVHLLQMEMPMLFSTRSTITTEYNHTKEDGTHAIFHSSKGN